MVARVRGATNRSRNINISTRKMRARKPVPVPSLGGQGCVFSVLPRSAAEFDSAFGDEAF